MKDFTLQAYKRYLQAIKSSFPDILRFDKYLLLDSKPEYFCLIRHDVDRKPQKALEMAKIEHSLGIQSTYYFRAGPKSFNDLIIKEITGLGHEIGYHYESLSHTNGDMILALEDFKDNLKKLREIVPVKTISMHGAPLKSIDNRDLWRDRDNHKLLLEELGILGEIYLDIDYSDVAYISDTGRNWLSTKSNIRDQVGSGLKYDFENGGLLYHYLTSNSNSRLVFQIHPERWTDKESEYYLILFADLTANIIKSMIKLLRK